MATFVIDWVTNGGTLIQATDKKEALEIFSDNLSVFLDEWDDYEVLEIQEVGFE